MSKKRKLDFILYEDDGEKLVFRFYPRRSSCHSFGDEPPKEWSDVYKVYYAYSIFRYDKDFKEHTTLFNCPCDECSSIGEVAARIKCLLDGKETITRSRNGEEWTIDLLGKEIVTFGDGVDWQIDKLDPVDELSLPTRYKFMMWLYDEIGFRFVLKKEQMKAFGEYLESCCEYMLAHGEPI